MEDGALWKAVFKAFSHLESVCRFRGSCWLGSHCPLGVTWGCRANKAEAEASWSQVGALALTRSKCRAVATTNHPPGLQSAIKPKSQPDIQGLHNWQSTLQTVPFPAFDHPWPLSQECFLTFKPLQNPIPSPKPAIPSPWLPWSVFGWGTLPLLSFPDTPLAWGQDLF